MNAWMDPWMGFGYEHDRSLDAPAHGYHSGGQKKDTPNYVDDYGDDKGNSDRHQKRPETLDAQRSALHTLRGRPPSMDPKDVVVVNIDELNETVDLEKVQEVIDF